MEYPDKVKQFLAALDRGGVQVEIEATGDGTWWIDLRKERRVSVQWHTDRGFGLAAQPSVYGAGPTEIFHSSKRAALRALQLAAPRSAPSPGGLAAVRQLYGMTQQEVAQKLAKGQPAVSQIEKGRDSKLETIDSYIRALGGRMEVRAVFPDGSLPITLSRTKGTRHAATKSRRPARARS